MSLTKPSSQTVTVNYGSAKASSDYIATSRTLTFVPHQATQTISIPLIGDTIVEANETLFVLLSGAVSASIGRGRGVGYIINDDTSGD